MRARPLVPARGGQRRSGGGPPELPAASGGIGGTTQGFGSEEEYKRAYIDCMRGGGHNVIN